MTATRMDVLAKPVSGCDYFWFLDNNLQQQSSFISVAAFIWTIYDVKLMFIDGLMFFLLSMSLQIGRAHCGGDV